MVLLLNLAFIAVVVVIGLVWLKTKNWKVLIALPVLAFLYSMAQPSYIPKGTVQVESLPAFEKSTKPMVDRYLHTPPGSEHDKWREEQDKAVRRRLKEAE